MFIVSAKFSPRKAIAAVVACAAVLILMILLISSLKGRPSPGEELITAASEEERAEYLRSLGWENPLLRGVQRAAKGAGF